MTPQAQIQIQTQAQEQIAPEELVRGREYSLTYASHALDAKYIGELRTIDGNNRVFSTLCNFIIMNERSIMIDRKRGVASSSTTGVRMVSREDLGAYSDLIKMLEGMGEKI